MNSLLIVRIIYYLVIGVVMALALMHFGVIPAGAAPVEKVVICHIPPGNPDNTHTIEVGEPAVPAHLAHGDTLGACSTPKLIPTEVSFMPTPTVIPHGSHSEASSIAISAVVSLPSTGVGITGDDWPFWIRFLVMIGAATIGVGLVWLALRGHPE